MTYVDDLKTARDNVAARLKEITAAPKPSYDIDGQQVSWGDYLAQLTAGLDMLEKKIAAQDSRIGITQLYAGS